jgi:hypothetical protein
MSKQVDEDWWRPCLLGWNNDLFPGRDDLLCRRASESEGPEGCQPEPLDHQGNAGYEGNWWGVTTDKYGNPYVQQEASNDAMHPYPGLWVSAQRIITQYPEYDCWRWVNPETVAFTVIPE